MKYGAAGYLLPADRLTGGMEKYTEDKGAVCVARQESDLELPDKQRQHEQVMLLT